MHPFRNSTHPISGCFQTFPVLSLPRFSHTHQCEEQQSSLTAHIAQLDATTHLQQVLHQQSPYQPSPRAPPASRKTGSHSPACWRAPTQPTHPWKPQLPSFRIPTISFLSAEHRAQYQAHPREQANTAPTIRKKKSASTRGFGAAV